MFTMRGGCLSLYDVGMGAGSQANGFAVTSAADYIGQSA